MNSLVARIVILILIAGVLLPVITATDDSALLSAAIDELTPAGPVEVRAAARNAHSDSSAVFWAQFEHMDAPVLPAATPGIEPAGAICCSEPELHSVQATDRSGRGPPRV